MPTITARLEAWLDEELREFWERQGEGPSAGLRQVAREWWALQQYPEIVFRDGPSGRRAGLRNGPDVWEVALVAPAYDGDPERISQHLGERVSTSAVEQALAYAHRFPEEIEARLGENARFESLLTGRVPS